MSFRVFAILGLLVLAGCTVPAPGSRGRGMGLAMMRRMMGNRGMPPAVTPAPTATPGGDVGISYRRDVQPIFSRSCVACHGGSAGLWLESYDRVMAGSANGPMVVPGQPEASELYRRITGERQPQMPLGRPSLNSKEVEFIRTWIAAGAPNN